MENIVVEKLHSGAVNEILKIKLFKIYITIWAKIYLFIHIKNVIFDVLFHIQKTAYLYLFLFRRYGLLENAKKRLNLEDIPWFP